MSSKIASEVRKTLTLVGTREPSSESTASAKAMSVAAGIAQPCRAEGSCQLIARYNSAGINMPPTAPRPGSTMLLSCDSSPRSTSRFSSNPISRKKTAIMPSLIQSSSGLAISRAPT